MMNPTPPLLYGTLLAAMIAAGISHFWTVREVISRYPSASAHRIDPPADDKKTNEPAKQLTPTSPQTAPLARGSEEERKFYAALLSEMKALRNENKNLIDQIGETNRDMMKMEFRMDTYSESFRPLPVQERFDDTTFGSEPEFPGVLPPKATPVYPVEE